MEGMRRRGGGQRLEALRKKSTSKTLITDELIDARL
jgi:hypothetical protein